MAEHLLPMLGRRVERAIEHAFGSDAVAPETPVLPARDPRHGDYSVSAPMALARTLRQAPLALAERLAAALDLEDVCEEPTVAPPGFVNLRLRSDWLAARVASTIGDPRLGVDPEEHPERVVIDYSAPNLAKQMHVGNLRSTIIGDCLSRVDEFLGHQVERVSHVGDWGTQFGMLVTHLEETEPEVLAGGEAHIADLDAFYREANIRFGQDEAFKDRARRRVVDLQSGEQAARTAWRASVAASSTANAKAYELLGIHGLVERGESFYEPMLPAVVADLETAGLVVLDQGAKCVFVEGFTNKEGKPLPLIVVKADGGYNYATTDLAAVRHRVGSIGADRVLYVVDAGQSQHFEMVFAVAHKAGWVPPGVVLEHVPFGLVLDKDGQRMRTRTGDNLPLIDLLVEAKDRARAFVVERADERGQDLPDDVDTIARVVGIGAVKYADLSQSRQSNYMFSFDKLLSLKGNTAPYLQYSYARIRSILREGGEPEGAVVVLDESQERDLARRLVDLGDVLDRVEADNAPNHLCAYLFDLSQAYNSFYEHCPVLRSEEPVRSSRLALCAATAATLSLGLDLLGIEVLEKI